MFSNTLKTIFGFIRSVFHRRFRIGRKNESIADIYNFLLIDDLFATSGQPSEFQFALIRDAGYETVINLAPTSVFENAVVDEGEILADLGIKYVHIPVDFKNPTEDDFAQFVTCVNEHAGKKVWVHCAANMRVSAFTYRYRRSALGQDESVAGADLQKIWAPMGVWKKFVNQ